MKFEIKKHRNGYVLQVENEEEGVVYREEHDSEIQAWRDFLWEITDTWGPDSNRSRYSPARIEIRIRPGDKSENADQYFCEHCGQYKEVTPESDI